MNYRKTFHNAVYGAFKQKQKINSIVKTNKTFSIHPEGKKQLKNQQVN